MTINMGDTIAEFKESTEAEGGYSTRIKRLYVVQGRIPADGGWQLICLSDTGFQENLPKADVEANDGRYIVGGREIVFHAAGFDEPKKTVKVNITEMKAAAEEEDF